VHRLEIGPARADAARRREAEPAGDAGGDVRENVAKGVGGEDDVEISGMTNKLERAGVDFFVSKATSGSVRPPQAR
jgi:hypothetical protein